MPTIQAILDERFRKAISDAFGIDADPLIGLSQNEKFGDYQSNAAMGLAKVLSEKTGQKTNPRAVAEQIKSKLNLGEIASEISIAGPGFINVRLSPAWLEKRLEGIALAPSLGIPGEGENAARLGIEKISPSETIVVDYSGPNIAKEMHVGHLRSTIIGDAISRVLEFQGHKIIRQNHIGDWGTQFGMLIAELQLQYAEADLKNRLSSTTGIRHTPGILLLDLEGFYQKAKAHYDSDPVFREQSRQQVVSLQSGNATTLRYWAVIVEATRLHYVSIYQRLGVLLRQEAERGESFYNPKLAAIVEDLLNSGIAERSEGAIVVKVPGYASPLIIQKSDGGYLYGTTDLAAIRYRVNELHADRIIYTHDSRQQQHFAQVFWTADKAGWISKDRLIYAPFGTMLGEDGKPFKTRTGGTVKLKDLLDEAEERALVAVSEKNSEMPVEQRKDIAHKVGIGAVKYADLAKDRISDYAFSFDKILALDGNTAPYIQYAHARVKSIFRKAKDSPGPIRLESSYELALAKHILRLGEMIEQVARELKPHHLCSYLYELATLFSGFFENCPVLQSETETRRSRLSLCDLAARTLALGLDLLGIEHPDQM